MEGVRVRTALFQRIRVLLAATAAISILLAATVAPAAAVNPGPTLVPALTGVVTDACTGLPILRGLTVGVAQIDPASGQPGPSQKPPGPSIFGLFTYPTLDPGPISLTVSAQGYLALGADPATGASPGVTIERPPGPNNLPAGQSFASGILLDIRLIPAYTGGPCRPPGPSIFPAVSGRGVDAATGRGLTGLTVGLAPLVVDPTTGAIGPGPIQKPPSPNFLGLFVFRDPGPTQFGFQFYAAAAGHTRLGADPTKPPGPSQFGPGVTLSIDPGPIALPAGSGTVNQSIVVAFALPAGG